MVRVKSSPCIGFCSTTYGDHICRGCFRNLDEVLHWRQKSPEEQQQYYSRMSRYVAEILSVYWELNKPIELIEKIIQDKEIFLPPEGLICPYFSLFQLLQHGVNPIANYPEYISWKTLDMSLGDLSRVVSRFVYVSSENAL